MLFFVVCYIIWYVVSKDPMVDFNETRREIDIEDKNIP